MMYSIPALLLVLAGSTRAHIEMTNPPPLRSQYNPYVSEGDVDYDMTSPITDLADFPCKGYLSDPEQPTANYTAGETYLVELSGSATHMGGSCQLSMSYDKGKTFQVIKNIIGGCPINLEYNFTIPEDAPSGDALFSWSWMNHMGNREFYQNCAWVTIDSSSDASSLDSPDYFVGNLPGYCTVPEGYDFVYPNTDPVVEWGGDPAYYTDVCADGTNETSGNGTVSVSGEPASSTSAAVSSAESIESSPSAVASAAGPASSALGSLGDNAKVQDTVASSTSEVPSAIASGVASSGVDPSGEDELSVQAIPSSPAGGYQVAPSGSQGVPPQQSVSEGARPSHNGSHRRPSNRHNHERPQVSQLSTPHPTIDVAGGTIVQAPCSR